MDVEKCNIHPTFIYQFIFFQGDKHAFQRFPTFIHIYSNLPVVVTVAPPYVLNTELEPLPGPRIGTTT